jgi:predicted GH43/DUF377 family glycosyl hydrolase
MKKWLFRLSVVLGIGLVLFLGLHAVIPSGQARSQHTVQNESSPWKRVAATTGNPASIFDGSRPISDPWVMRDGDLYKMWFTLVADPYTAQQTIGLAYAESADGLHWKTDGKQVLSPRANEWDSLSVETACVVKVSEEEYLLYYTAPEAPEGNHHFRIGLATSRDGKSWTRVGDGPVLIGEYEWEKPFRDEPGGAIIGGVLEPSVHFDCEQKIFRMWYVGLGKTANDFPKYRIGYATSNDGKTWERRADPVLEPGASGSWDDATVSHVQVTIDTKGKHHLLYFGSSVSQFTECEALGECAMTPGSIGYASSDDGLTWKRDALPILSPTGTGWESWALGGPTVLQEANGFRMWYFGNPAHNSYNSRIGVAKLDVQP